MHWDWVVSWDKCQSFTWGARQKKKKERKEKYQFTGVTIVWFH